MTAPMRWKEVALEAIGYDLPDERVTTAALEDEMADVYRALHLAPGQVESLTGVRERRVWPRGTKMSERGAVAARRALDAAGLDAKDLGAVIYAGVCRDDLEPATACAIADSLGARGDVFVYDVSNACLGVMNAMVDVANRIELGQICAGVVVSAESSREIVAAQLARMKSEPTMDRLRLSLATLTGGSGAVAVVLTHLGSSFSERRLVGGAALAAPEHHRICRWGPSEGLLGETTNVMETDASLVLNHGVTLGKATWDRFLGATAWRPTDVDKVVCHQVGAPHRDEVLRALDIDRSRDFSSFEHLGNIGTVSLSITLALAAEAGFVSKGDRVALLGIGSGLNCLMLGAEW
jgi:acyl-CoA:acyl-CoA alkyltransferase